MKQKYEQLSMVAAIQKNLRNMQEQAQHYIDKHHTALPPLCSARHYLIHDLTKRQTIDVGPSDKNSPSSLSQADQSGSPKHEKSASTSRYKQHFSPKTTIFNMEFSRKGYNQPKRYVRNSIKQSLNCTSLKMKTIRSRSLEKAKCDSNLSLLKRLPKDLIQGYMINSQIADLAHINARHKSDSYWGKLNLPHWQMETMNKYTNRFKDSNFESPQSKLILQQTLQKSEKSIIQKFPKNIDTFQQRRRFLRKIENPKQDSIRQRKQCPIKQSTAKKSNGNTSYDQIDYTPWDSTDNIQDCLSESLWNIS